MLGNDISAKKHTINTYRMHIINTQFSGCITIECEMKLRGFEKSKTILHSTIQITQQYFYKSMHFKKNLDMNWHNLFTLQAITGIVKVQYYSPQTILWNRLGPNKASPSSILNPLPQAMWVPQSLESNKPHMS